MKKKFTYGLLLLATIGFSSNVFTSCKDNDEDIQTVMNKNDQALKDLIDQLKRAQEECKQSCSDKFQDILNKLGDKADAATLSKLQSDFDALLERIGETGKTWTEQEIRNMILEYCNYDYIKKLGFLTADDLKDINISITNINNQLNQVFGEGGLKDQITTLQNNYNTLSGNYEQLIKDLEAGKYGLTEQDVKDIVEKAYGTQIQTIITNITNLQTLVGEHSTALSELKTTVGSLDTRLTKAEKDAVDALTQANLNSAAIGAWVEMFPNSTITEEIKALQTKDEDLQRQLNTQSEKDKELEGLIQALDQKLDTHLAQYAIDLEALKNRVTACETAIEEIKTELQKLTQLEERLNSLITGMIVQGVYNPLFGTFSLPIGVQSNMLVNYYGFSDKPDFSFPSTQQIATVDNEPELTADEYEVLQASGLVPETIANGAVLIEEGNANLGKLFVTINPNNVDFTNGDLTLVNSQDENCTVKLKNLRRSDEVLTFGYSARSAQNGFYEADAYLEPNLEAIDPVKVQIDQRLKTAMKDILSDGRSGLRANALNLMKALYDQINGMLPAYGLKAAWNVNGVDYATYSNYNIAATTFRPLSYSFMNGQSINHKFPVIDPISQTIFDLSDKLDDFKFDFSDVTVNLDGKDITLDFEIAPIELKYDGTLSAVVKGDVIDESGQKIGTVEAKGEVSQEDMDKFLANIEDEFNNKIGTWNESLNKAFRDAIDQMLTKVDSAVEDLLAQMQNKINDKIEDLVTEIQDEINGKVGNYVGKFNNFIERYNSIARRLNSMLEDPNHYMQPAIFYRGSSARDFLLSANPANPTVLVNDGGDGFMLYATSLNAEIVAPSYKKVVAVTNVIDNATGKSAANAKAQCATINKSTEWLAQVCPGHQKRFAIPTRDMKPGYTYEILYTSVDYHGVTATCRYYVTMR